MFSDCPYCGFPVALDDDGLPLPRCPNCAQRLRAGADAPDAQAATDAQEAGDGLDPVRTAPDHAAAPAAAEVPAVAPPASDAARLAPEAPPDAGETADPPATPGVAAAPPAPPAAQPAPAAPAAVLPVAAQPVAPQARTDADASSGNAAQGDDAGVAAASPRAPSATAAAASGSLQVAGPDATSAAPPEHRQEARAPAATAMQDDTSRAPDAIPDTHAAQAAADTDTAATTTVDAAHPVPHPAPADPAATPPPVARRRAAGAAPSFARSAARAPAVSGKRRALEAGAVAGLLLLLALQLLLADRARLAADARWRPVVAALCGALRCTLPAWRDPGAFRVVERDVRAHGAGVLRVSARIRNEARWAQPWPALQLTLSDTHGREVATRIFQPREYLGAAPSQPELASGQDASLSMEIVEPGKQAVAFTFDFR